MATEARGARPARPALRSPEVEPRQAGQAAPGWGLGRRAPGGAAARRQFPEPTAAGRRSLQNSLGPCVSALHTAPLGLVHGCLAAPPLTP